MKRYFALPMRRNQATSRNPIDYKMFGMILQGVRQYLGRKKLRKSNRREKVGIVVSDKMEKTISVQVERTTRHPLYGKVIRKYTTFKVHDEENKARTGNKVRISETRPLSKTKRWRLVEIMEKTDSDNQSSEDL